MSYQAPLNDLRFALHTHAKIAEILTLPVGLGLDDETIDAILEEAGKFSEQELAPTNRLGDVHGAKIVEGKVVSHESIKAAFEAYRAAGWSGLRAPTDYGGQGLPSVVSTACEELFTAANLAFSLMPMLTMGAAEALLNHGSDEIKQTYLPKMSEGLWSGTMNLTEPQAGSDLAQVATKAEPNDDGSYAISGQKIFITWGEHELTENIIHLVLARLPDAPAGVKGISLFVVPKFLVTDSGEVGERNTLEVVSLEHKMGIHASPTCVMQFDGAKGYLVGTANRGLNHMFTMMNHARLGVGVEGHAIADRAYQMAVAYAKERVQSRAVDGDSHDAVAIIQHPDVRRLLLTQKATIEAQRALIFVAANLLDKATDHPVASEKEQSLQTLSFLIPIIKAWCTENANVLTNQALQVFGGMGYIEETGIAQLVRDARITAIYEGTTGIQALDLVGRKTAMDQGAAAKVCLAEGVRIAEGLAKAGATDLAQALSHALNLAKESATYVVMSFAQGQSAAAAAGSVPFLMQMGVTLGAIEMGRAYLASSEALKDPVAAMLPESFYEEKQQTVAVYFDHILVQIETYSRQLLNGSDSILKYNLDSF
ncbi:MAG: acyl-CoA dehydrogenase [Neisseriaceae bacterium]|nr:acyl-CoA dehydrogenase [Neisseriaceae bacterium]